jgi:ABC-type nitrate/sulfonate/bicarbonate transport system substrate-binding protein
MKNQKQIVLKRAAKDNPDLSIAFIRELLKAKAECSKTATLFVPRGRR